MVQVHVIFDIETVEELERLKNVLKSEELNTLNFKTNANESWVKEEIQTINEIKNRVPHSADFQMIYENYLQTGKPIQAQTKKKIDDLWDVPEIVQSETPDVVEYLRCCIRDFNAKKIAEKIYAISFEFEAVQGRFEDLISIENVKTYNQFGIEIKQNLALQDQLIEHFYLYFDDFFLYEHLIENKVYSI